MSYDTENNKLRKNHQQENKNLADASLLKKIDTFDIPSQVLNKITTINLLKTYNWLTGTGTKDARVALNDNGLGMIVTLDKFPEWCIPFTKLIPKAYLSDDYNINQNDYTFDLLCRHWWRYISDTQIQLCVHFYASAYNTISGIPIPVYVDLDLVIINENVWESVNPNKQ